MGVRGCSLQTCRGGSRRIRMFILILVISSLLNLCQSLLRTQFYLLLRVIFLLTAMASSSPQLSAVLSHPLGVIINYLRLNQEFSFCVPKAPHACPDITLSFVIAHLFVHLVYQAVSSQRAGKVPCLLSYLQAPSCIEQFLVIYVNDV